MIANYQLINFTKNVYKIGRIIPVPGQSRSAGGRDEACLRLRIC